MWDLIESVLIIAYLFTLNLIGNSTASPSVRLSVRPSVHPSIHPFIYSSGADKPGCRNALVPNRLGVLTSLVPRRLGAGIVCNSPGSGSG